MASKNSTTDLGRTALVLVHWNTKVFLDECFASLLNQTYEDFDIFFIDNGSEDDGYDYVKRVWDKKFPNRISYFKTGKNLGFAAGHNIGINKAVEKDNYKSIAILNLDTKVDKDWLKNLVSRLHTDKEIAIATSKIFLYEKYKLLEVTVKNDTLLKVLELDSPYRKILYRPTINRFRGFLTSLIRMDFNKLTDNQTKHIYESGTIWDTPIQVKKGEKFIVGIPFKDKKAQLSENSDITIKILSESTAILQNYGSEFDNKIFTYRDKYFLIPESEIETEEYSEAACGCALALKTNVVKEIGPLDETLISYYEDTEISERYKKDGYRIAMADQAHVYHYFWGGTSFRKDEASKRKGFEFREYYWRRNRLLIVKRYNGIFAYIYTFLRQVGLIGLWVIDFRPNPYKWLILKSQIRGTLDSLFTK